MGVQVGQILRQAALRAPERVALCDVGHAGAVAREHTYGELDRAARRAAAVLIGRGVRPGQCVALCGESSAAFVAAWFGVVYAGATVVPVPIASSGPELRHRVVHSRAVLVLHDAPRAELIARAQLHDALANDASTSPHGIASLGLEALEDASIEPIEHPFDTSAAATAMVLYTSGTTGTAKGAEISHASLLLHTATLVQHALALGENDVVLCTLPLTHSFGCRMAMLAPFFALAKVVLVPRFDAPRTLELARAQGVTWFPAVPTMLAAWGNLPSVAPIRTLRWVLSAGAPLADETARRAEAALGCEVRQGFGMTEATFASINSPPDARVLGSVGKATWGTSLRIVDDAGHDVPPGQSGELLVRGHNVMTRYLHDPAASLAVSEDGWMHSGDVARLDEHGRLWIVDRLKDLIIRGGFNVYPSEVEDALARHPDVAEIAVIGRPDAFYGEEVVAVLVLRPGCTLDVESLDALAREHLSKTKQPREYAAVPTLPLGASGKVQKRELRAYLAEGKLSVIPVTKVKP